MEGLCLSRYRVACDTVGYLVGLLFLLLVKTNQSEPKKLDRFLFALCGSEFVCRLSGRGEFSTERRIADVFHCDFFSGTIGFLSVQPFS